MQKRKSTTATDAFYLSSCCCTLHFFLAADKYVAAKAYTIIANIFFDGTLTHSIMYHFSNTN